MEERVHNPGNDNQVDAQRGPKKKKEDPYKWGEYLSDLEQRVGPLSGGAKRAIKGLYVGRKKIEREWMFGEISVKERTDKKFALAQRFSRNYGQMIDQDKRLREAVEIIRDETG